MYILKKERKNMIKILKKATYNDLMKVSEESKKQEETINSLSTQLEELSDKLNKIEEANQKENSVTISFDDTLEKASPILKYKSDIADKLIELKLLDINATDKYSIELAMMSMAEEVLNQILDSFAEPFEEV